MSILDGYKSCKYTRIELHYLNMRVKSEPVRFNTMKSFVKSITDKEFEDCAIKELRLLEKKIETEKRVLPGITNRMALVMLGGKIN